MTFTKLILNGSNLKALVLISLLAVMAACATDGAKSQPPSQPTLSTPKSNQWSIGDGEHRKSWDHEPSAAEIRQWKYDTILQTAGPRHANEWMKGEMERERAKRQLELMDLEIQRQRQGLNGRN